MWRSLFLVNLQACRLITGNFTIKRTPSQVLFDSILTPPPMLPACIELTFPIKWGEPLSMFSTPVGNPETWCFKVKLPLYSSFEASTQLNSIHKNGHVFREVKWSICNYVLGLHVCNLATWLHWKTTFHPVFTCSKINNGKTKTKRKVCSKLIIMTLDRHQWCRSGIFVVNSEQISQNVEVFPLFTLNK